MIERPVGERSVGGRPVSDIGAVQRRTLGTLVGAQAFGGIGVTLGVATAALLGEEVSGSAELAGLVQTAQVLGTALASYVLARVMGLSGRRPGLTLGYAIGTVGAVLCVVAGAASSYALLLVAAALLGATTAANNQSRYAATDLAAPQQRARHLSIVVWATTIGAVVGPNLAGPAGDLAEAVGIPELTGPFAAGALGMGIAGLVLLVGLRPDPLVLARELAAVPEPGPVAPPPPRGGVASLRARPTVAAAVVGMALAHATMVAVMIMTPLHMHHGGADLEVIGFVISIHVIGMYALSPLVGWLVDAVGSPRVLALGAVVLLVSLLLSGRSPQGSSVEITVGLLLLGVGWSLATVAASTLLTAETPLAERTGVQGVADLTMGLTAAAAGAVAGVIVGSWGYGWLNAFGAVLAVGVLVAAAAGARHARRAADLDAGPKADPEADLEADLEAGAGPAATPLPDPPTRRDP